MQVIRRALSPLIKGGLILAAILVAYGFGHDRGQSVGWDVGYSIGMRRVEEAVDRHHADATRLVAEINAVKKLRDDAELAAIAATGKRDRYRQALSRILATQETAAQDARRILDDETRSQRRPEPRPYKLARP